LEYNKPDFRLGGIYIDGRERRILLLKKIMSSEQPITGAELAANLNVSRQVVVQDIALLRASGVNIVATLSGYIHLPLTASIRPVRVFTCRHTTLEEVEKELMVVIKHGGKVRDVVIEHPVYGEIAVQLMLSTVEAVKELVAKLAQKGSAPLSTVTDGVHMHTVEADSEALLDEIEKELCEANIIF